MNYNLVVVFKSGYTLKLHFDNKEDLQEAYDELYYTVDTGRTFEYQHPNEQRVFFDLKEIVVVYETREKK